MTKMIAEILIGTAQYRESSGMSDAQLGFWGALIGVVISAFVAFIVSKIQVSSAEKNLDKQIQAEIKKVEQQYDFELKKIEKQYTFEQKRDNKNYIVKLRIEKAAELLVNLTELNEISGEYYINLQNKSIGGKHDQKIINQFTSYESRISILINYFPTLRDEWKEIRSFLLDTTQIFVFAFVGEATINEDTTNQSQKDMLEYYGKIRNLSINLSNITDEILNNLE